MNPFKQLDKAKKVVNDLTFKLKYSKNKVKDAEGVNELIRTIKLFDSMLVSKYKTDAIDKLLSALIYEILMINKAYDSAIPLKDIIHTVQNAINYDKQYKKSEVISILKHHEMQNKIKNNSVFEKDYINFDELLNKLMNEFKQSMVWNT